MEKIIFVEFSNYCQKDCDYKDKTKGCENICNLKYVIMEIISLMENIIVLTIVNIKAKHKIVKKNVN